MKAFETVKFRRSIALLLTLCALLSCVPSSVFAAPETAVETAESVEHKDTDLTGTSPVQLCDKDEPVSAIELSAEESMTITARYTGEGKPAYYWQIYSHDEGKWVEIIGENTATLRVSHALTGEMLSDDNVALINCKVKAGDNLFYSDALHVLMLLPEKPVEEHVETAPAEEMVQTFGLMTASLEDIPSTVAETQPPIEGGELVTHTVTVKYTFYDGTKDGGYQAAQYYTATVKPNDDTGLTVHPDCPTLVGYTPYILTVDGKRGENERWLTNTDANAREVYKDAYGNPVYGIEKHKLTLDLSKVSEDATYEVFYIPNEVTYTVSHYVQNIVNDDYVLYYVETKTGYVGQYTEATDLTRTEVTGVNSLKDGYISLVPFDDQPIAADGTTQINAYYDRVYYLMTFKLSGGVGMEPIYARYGTPITISDPERQGYQFVNWTPLEMLQVAKRNTDDTEIAGEFENAPRPRYEEGKGNVGTGYFALEGAPDVTSEWMPGTMPAQHTAYFANWQAVDSIFTVNYWLEKPNYTGTEVQYDYWCVTTVSASSESVIGGSAAGKLSTDYLTNPQWSEDGSGTGAAGRNVHYEQRLHTPENPLETRDLAGQGFTLVPKGTGQCLTAAIDSNPDSSVVSMSAFYLNNHTTEWVFIRAQGNQYKLRTGGQYLVMDAAGNLSMVGKTEDATAFTVAQDSTDTNCITLQAASDIYLFGNGTTSGTIQLYTFTGKGSDPEMKFYYYDHWDGDGVKVAADGTTVVNVYYRRNAYNLRYFYARSSGTGTNIQYEVPGGSINAFASGTTSTNIETLLGRVDNGKWGVVEDLPDLFYDIDDDPSNDHIYKKDSLPITQGTTEYTYYFFTFSARYGEDISNPWPSDAVAPVANGGFRAGSNAIFSAWAGEASVYYNQDSNLNHGNYTIKGNYQLMDTNIMYKNSYTGYEHVGVTGKDTTDGYLDFIAFWENASISGISWNVPKQFHYYLWALCDDQSDTAKQASNVLSELIHTDDDFQKANTYLMLKKDTNWDSKVAKAVIDGKLYFLYDKVDCCDNSETPSHQTSPGIAGYDHLPQDFTAGYGDFASPGQHYYRNTQFDTTMYQKSFSINYLFTPKLYSITLHSHTSNRVLTDVAYNSMRGAVWVEGVYGKNQMEELYYPEELPEGAYTFGGWYKDENCTPGNEANLSIPMPNKNMMLYAKWVPKQFDVQVYQTSQKSNMLYYLDDDGTAREMAWRVEYQQDPNDPDALIAKEGTGMEYDQSLNPQIIEPAGPNISVDPLTREADIPQNIHPEDCTNNGTGQIREKWIFVCYAYEENGVEHAVDVASFTVHDDVDLYAKWTASNIISYQVRYALADIESTVDASGNSVLLGKRYEVDENNEPVYENGQLQYLRDEDGNFVYEPMTFDATARLYFADGLPWIPAIQNTSDGDPLYIADATKGNQNEGANRTFDAKTGLQLYGSGAANNPTPGVSYQMGCFPLTANHTMLMEPREGEEGTEDNPITFTFYYVRMSSVPYTVRYWDANANPMADCDGDGDIDRDDIPGKVVRNPDLSDPKDTLKMVVTENYIFNPGYTADAFQKTLVLSANPAENVITFHYSHESDKSPFTVIYYYQTFSDQYDYLTAEHLDDSGEPKRYREYTTANGSVLKTDHLNVEYMTISGYEYARDQVTAFKAGTDGTTVEEPTKMTDNRAQKEIAGVEMDKEGALTDSRGEPVTIVADDSEDVGYRLECDGTKHEGVTFEHDLTNTSYFYTGDNGIRYEVREIDIVGTTATLTVYAIEGTAFEVDPGERGTVVRVFYDLKKYPYYVYHVSRNPAGVVTTLDMEAGKAQFQDTVTKTSWSESELIDREKLPGYTVDSSNKTITMTMMIRDDVEAPTINTMTFTYFEREVEYRYIPMLWKNSTETDQAKNLEKMYVDGRFADENLKLTLTREGHLNTYSGHADPAQPLVNDQAYIFKGWYLDEACTQPVAADPAYYQYLGTGTQMTVTDGESFSVLTGQLSAQTDTGLENYPVLQPQKLKGTYFYSEVLEENGTSTVRYESRDLKDTDGLYVGALQTVDGHQVHTANQTFYALFVPRVGSLTIQRQNTGADKGHNEANSFVYTIKRVKDENGNALGTPDYVMTVTIDPGEDSVNIVNLPFGEYEITQINNWSWRYGDTQKTVTIGVNSVDPVAEFDDDPNTKWLSGFAETVKNIFGGS